jgi:hypothetical protein
MNIEISFVGMEPEHLAEGIARYLGVTDSKAIQGLTRVYRTYNGLVNDCYDSADLDNLDKSQTELLKLMAAQDQKNGLIVISRLGRYESRKSLDKKLSQLIQLPKTEHSIIDKLRSEGKYSLDKINRDYEKTRPKPKDRSIIEF